MWKKWQKAEWLCIKSLIPAAFIFASFVSWLDIAFLESNMNWSTLTRTFNVTATLEERSSEEAGKLSAET